MGFHFYELAGGNGVWLILGHIFFHPSSSLYQATFTLIDSTPPTECGGLTQTTYFSLFLFLFYFDPLRFCVFSD